MPMTTLAAELARPFDGNFKALILDNEVTVDAFVTDPPLPWARLTVDDGIYKIGEGYPTSLTSAEAEREKLNWDSVSNAAICEALRGIDDTARFANTRTSRGHVWPLLPGELHRPLECDLVGRLTPLLCARGRRHDKCAEQEADQPPSKH